ncbi:hypothetical protein HGO53_00110 [Wolbachia endosymbiont of Diaphorina citri]|jgi:hypothetical protein|uniref:hypothetical protein n=1 Tax=Wolbachia endosymbiont of Diaphorina citri TaxID=116598 RepID=UPI0002D79B66|nr:hypothetical protein [Wolbachia endosymbiont of Diaphorina citri]KAI5695476.1 hypothetical protein M8J77_006530 [Diaphorina citri]QJT93930.1 hypothetical protein HGO48_00110 [Wolbachia endosymbiont of Diaphorina citri]QJT95170.1 hypothetical protein HGO49_00110 [Wolbachia endosymbiont of Diaphorina citri]QJT96417.1 hypothetical protein HGO53_00110 [Wolbachia endosymbiont of Diaphorina citri]QLK10827.1 hypothetical protein FK497_00110 [Wolbachia endosymbiont of Diaphorina citri]
MNTQSTQQYHEFIRGFFTLFDEIKKEDDPIYNSRVGFNAVKFLIKHPIWNLEIDEDKNKAYEVILPEQNKIKKAEQKLESEVKARLKEYVDDIAGVSIYGDHASITLGDDKKEFKISEFLNSDFCQKKGISGFSTLHSDGKSGMHGFVAEEGEKRIRHYVVIDGSYEMTLNWYDKNGKKCTIKIKIDKDGVDLTERNGVTEEQLKANTDVKIGGLFLYQIQFKEKGQEQEKQQSSETFIESDISKGIGVQATQDQEVEFKHATTSTTNSNNASAKKIPPSLPPRTSSLPNNQQKGEYQPIRINSRNNYNSPYSDHSNSTAFTKSVSQNQNDRQSTFTTFGYTASGSRKSDESEQISNNRQKGAIFDPTTTESAAPVQDVAFKKVKDAFKYENAKESRNTGNKQPLNDVASILAWKAKNELLRSESEYDEEFSDFEDGWSDNEDEYITLSKPQSDYKQEKDYLSTKENEERGNDEQKETEQENESLEYSSTDIKTNDSGYSSPTHSNHEKSRVNSGQLKASLMNVEQRDDTLLTEFTSKLDKETQKFLLKPVNQKKMSEQTKEHLLAAGLLKDNAAEKEINDSGYSSPTYTSHDNFQVNSEQLEKRLETIEPKDTLEKLNKGLRDQATKDLFSESMLKEIKEGKKYDPVRKLLERKVAEQEAEQENDNTNLTIDKNSELCKLLEKDAAQLKAGIEEERKDTLTERNDSPDRNRIALANRNRIWAKLIAEEKQKKDSGISIG